MLYCGNWRENIFALTWNSVSEIHITKTKIRFPLKKCLISVHAGYGNFRLLSLLIINFEIPSRKKAKTCFLWNSPPLPPPRCYEFDVKCTSFYKIANILYSEDLSTRDNFLRNGWNDGQTLITKPLYSKHFMVDTSL